MQTLITHGIRVSIETRYMPEYSRPLGAKYIYAYRVVIENQGNITVQLLRRRFQINDSNGENRIIEGEGVIGLQPVLEPGETHQYVSWCDLRTEIGKMSGIYRMIQTKTGKSFNVQLPTFLFAAPSKLN